MSTTIVMCVDGGVDVGLGHWVRCVALGDEVQRRHPGISLVWLTAPVPESLAVELSSRGYVHLQGDWTDSARVAAVAAEHGASGVVIDLIDTRTEWVTALAESMRIVSVGGGGPGRDHVHHRVDGMIPRPGYVDGFRGQCLYLGPGFVILRPEFGRIERDAYEGGLERVVVAMGSDATGHGLQVASRIARLDPRVEIDVVTGLLADEPTGLPAGVRLHRGVDPLELYLSADVVVSAGGMTAFEAMRSGAPVVLLSTNDLQEQAARSMGELGVALLAGRIEDSSDVQDAALSDILCRLDDPAARATLGSRAGQLIDGRGLERVAAVIGGAFDVWSS